MNIIFKVASFNSDEHKNAIELRKKVLYEQRGISAKDYSEEPEHIQIVGFDTDNNIIATCSLVPIDNSCRMRYVAIDSSVQGLGVGSKMLEFCEKLAREKKFESIFCHARDTAISFYKKNGYLTEGEMFEQVTIPHIKMRKILFS